MSTTPRSYLLGFVLALLMTTPTCAFAQSSGGSQSQLIALLEQLVQILTAELSALQQQVSSSISTAPAPASIPGQSTGTVSVPQPSTLPPQNTSAPHVCPLLTVTGCTTAPLVQYDANGCMISYTCTPTLPQVGTQTSVTLSSSTTNTLTPTGSACLVSTGATYPNGSIVGFNPCSAGEACGANGNIYLTCREGTWLYSNGYPYSTVNELPTP